MVDGGWRMGDGGWWMGVAYGFRNEKACGILNPNGILSYSPGLRRSRYPGNRQPPRANPNGVV
jgi:hypothetical protein